MPRVRLSPFVSIVPVGSEVYVRSDLKAYALSGEAVVELTRRALPLFQGTHDVESIVAALGDYTRESVIGLLERLESLGAIQLSEEFTTGADSMHEQGLAAFLRCWKDDPHASMTRVTSAEVAVIGLTEWAATPCEHLVQASVSGLTILDVAGHLDGPHRATFSAARFMDRLAALDSPTKLSLETLTVEGGRLSPARSNIQLLLITLGSDELFLLDVTVKMAHAQKLPYLIAHIDGLNAVLGPLVIPGETACWECLRRRSLANQPLADQAAAFQGALLAGHTGARRSLLPAGVPSVLGGLISLEAIRILSNYGLCPVIGRQLTMHAVTYETRLHGIVRLPWCPVCGGSAASDRHGHSGNDPDASRRRIVEQTSPVFGSSKPHQVREALSGWLDDRTGVVRHLAIHHPSPEEPHSLTTTTAVIAAHAVPGQCAQEPLIGSGKGISKTAAMIGAVGEAIERYSASIYREADLLRASPHELGSGCLNPSLLCLYLPEQYAQPEFPFDRFNPDREISWTEGVWLDSQERVLVAALPTYFNYRAPRGERFCQVTSSGLAAGATFEDASLRATLELIERDAFMMTWLLRRPPRRLEVDSDIGADVLDVLAELRELGMDANLYVMDSDVEITNVMCVAWGDGTVRPAATVALASHVDPIEAVRKAILEQAHIGPYVTRLMADSGTQLPRAAADVMTLNDHALFYVPRARLKAFDFIRSGRRPSIRVGRLKRWSTDGLNSCIAALADAGLRIAIADVTASDVRLSPFSVARALGPHIQPIDFGYANRRLANPRLVKRGRRINPDPHPLA